MNFIFLIVGALILNKEPIRFILFDGICNVYKAC